MRVMKKSDLGPGQPRKSRSFWCLPNGPLDPPWLQRFLRHRRTVALVGPPRCGKSTLARQLHPDVVLDDPRSLRPEHLGTEGLILIDRNDVVKAPRGNKPGEEGWEQPRVLLVGRAPGTSPLFCLRMSGLAPGRDFPLDEEHAQRFWRRGGLPESFFADSEGESQMVRRTYWEHFGPCPEWDWHVPVSDRRQPYRLGWDCGLERLRRAATGELFPEEERLEIWETCVLTYLERALRLTDPQIEVHPRAAYGYRVFVLRSYRWSVALSPRLVVKRVPYQALQFWAMEQGHRNVYLVVPQGPLCWVKNAILCGGLAAVAQHLAEAHRP